MAQFQHLDASDGYGSLHGGSNPLARERPSGPRQTGLHSRFDREPIASGQAREFRGGIRAAAAWRRGVAQRQFRGQSGKGRYGPRQVPGQNAFTGHRDAVGGETDRAKHEQQNSRGHCVRLLTAWYISSAAFTTLELAS